MKHAWWLLALSLGGLAGLGCSSSSGSKPGEPQLGDVMITVSNDSPMLAAGAAIQDPGVAGNTLIQLGTDAVDCTTNLSSTSYSVGNGVFVSFSADKTTPGPVPNAFITVTRISGTNLDGTTANGTVTITSLGDRVQGSITFDDTSMYLGTVTMSGDFDVKNCLVASATGG
jgi:hypothetical protein